MIFLGIINPSFGEFWYYYITDVRGVSQISFGLLATIGTFGVLSGLFIFRNYLAGKEFRTLLYISSFVSFLGSTMILAFVLKENKVIGLGDSVALEIQSLVFGSLGFALNTFPLLILFARITPENQEATMFSFLNGVYCLSQNVISPLVGYFINYNFLNVTRDELATPEYLKIAKLQIIFTIVPFFLVWLLIPNENEITAKKSPNKR